MSIGNELGLNIIPQYTDFNIRFTNVTRDGSALNFSGVNRWIFAMSNQLTGTPTVLKSSSGVASGDFAFDYQNRVVTVGVRASEISNSNGQYFASLYAEISGKKITHRQKYITIEPQMNPTGV